MENETICFPAQVVKVQTLADGGIRLTLDLPETAIFEAAQLMECKRIHAYGDIEFIPHIVTNCNETIEKGTERGGARMDSRRVEIRRDKRESS
jgi:hypothetical protein